MTEIDINWIPLGDYYQQWKFLGHDEALRIAEQIATVDYLMDIKEQLPNYELIQKSHERVILISLGGLFEYGLKKAAHHCLEQAVENEPIVRTLKIEKEERRLDEEGMESTITRLHGINLLNDSWFQFLNRVRVLRDEVHMDRSRDDNIQEWLELIRVSGIREKIDEFRNLIQQIIES